jgi:hypothetical protein
MRSRLLCVLGFAGALLAPASASAAIIDIHGTDVTSSWTVGSPGIFTTATGGEALTVNPPSPTAFAGKSLHIEMQMQGSETAITTGTRFVGTPDGIPDIWIWDAGGPVLTLNITFVDVTSMNNQFGVFNVLNMGGYDPGFTTNELVITGGSMANSLGGVGTKLSGLFNITIAGTVTPGQRFANNFTTVSAVYDLYAQQAVPEPSTLLLLGGGLAGLVIRRRQQNRAR